MLKLQNKKEFLRHTKFCSNNVKIMWLSPRRIALLANLFFACYFSTVMNVAIAGSGFTKQGNDLTAGLIQHLIAKGICKDNPTCWGVTQIYRKDGSGRIYLNMYGQKNTALTSIVTEFLVANGLQLTGGIGITLTIYSGPHTQYEGFFGRRGESIKLEINK